VYLHQIVELIGVPGRSNDEITALERRLGDLPTKTPRASGDEPRLRHVDQ
jgi:hypothetical protein